MWAKKTRDVQTTSLGDTTSIQDWLVPQSETVDSPVSFSPMLPQAKADVNNDLVGFEGERTGGINLTYAAIGMEHMNMFSYQMTKTL